MRPAEASDRFVGGGFGAKFKRGRYFERMHVLAVLACCGSESSWEFSSFGNVPSSLYFMVSNSAVDWCNGFSVLIFIYHS